ncbi:MAG: DUF2946 domain-containing protein [Xanthobacteraceae bacterium]|nr:MAG: DUF2946 domain-containing protein [Xanthobacteraceae bacterium]
MLARLRGKGWLRGAIGVATAFVFAVQMLMAGIAATQMATAGPFDSSAICYGGHSSDDNGAGSPTKQINHATCVICVLASFSAPLPSKVEPAHPIEAFVTAADRPAAQIRLATSRNHNPRTSQGPPQTV